MEALKIKCMGGCGKTEGEFVSASRYLYLCKTCRRRLVKRNQDSDNAALCSARLEAANVTKKPC